MTDAKESEKLRELEAIARGNGYWNHIEPFVEALTRERNEAREDAERLADVIRAALDAPIDLGELAGHSEGDAFRDGYELARTRIDAALTQEDA
jgi:hypothetical protein